MPDFFREWLLLGGAQSANTDRNGSGTNRPFGQSFLPFQTTYYANPPTGQKAPLALDWGLNM